MVNSQVLLLGSRSSKKNDAFKFYFTRHITLIAQYSKNPNAPLAHRTFNENRGLSPIAPLFSTRIDTDKPVEKLLTLVK